MSIRMVVFDVGGTLIDETRMWQRHAINLGVPLSELLTILEATIARREHHRHALAHFSTSYVPCTGKPPSRTFIEASTFDASDLYPDVVATFDELKARGYKIGIAGNQPKHAAQCLRDAGLAVDLVATSEAWGVSKPDPAFFEKLIEVSGTTPNQIAYVGDRLDNDVVPAKAAGLVAIFIERGIWGQIHAHWPEVAHAEAAIKSLAELPELLAEH